MGAYSFKEALSRIGPNTAFRITLFLRGAQNVADLPQCVPLEISQEYPDTSDSRSSLVQLLHLLPTELHNQLIMNKARSTMLRNVLRPQARLEEARLDRPSFDLERLQHAKHAILHVQDTRRQTAHGVGRAQGREVGRVIAAKAVDERAWAELDGGLDGAAVLVGDEALDVGVRVQPVVL